MKEVIGQCLLYLKEILKFVVHFCRPALQEPVGTLIPQTPATFSAGNLVKEGAFFERFAIYPRLAFWISILIVLI